MRDLGECLPFTPADFLALVKRERQEFEQLMDIIQDRPNDLDPFVVDAPGSPSTCARGDCVIDLRDQDHRTTARGLAHAHFGADGVAMCAWVRTFFS